jgi:hypothetical protein
MNWRNLGGRRAKVFPANLMQGIGQAEVDMDGQALRRGPDTGYVQRPDDAEAVNRLQQCGPIAAGGGLTTARATAALNQT